MNLNIWRYLQICVSVPLNVLGTTTKGTNTLLELENSKNLNTTTLGKNISTMSHGCTD